MFAHFLPQALPLVLARCSPPKSALNMRSFAHFQPQALPLILARAALWLLSRLLAPRQTVTQGAPPTPALARTAHAHA